MTSATTRPGCGISSGAASDPPFQDSGGLICVVNMGTGRLDWPEVYVLITVDLLVDAVGSSRAAAARFAAPLNYACRVYRISETERRLAPFLAQTGHESASYSRQTESLDYSVDRLLEVFGEKRITRAQAEEFGRTTTRPADQQAIANIVYGGEWGARNLGNTQPGDGWRFRGRGPMGTTGRSNYRILRSRLRARLGPNVPDFEEQPEALEDPAWGALSAADFWERTGCNALADVGDFEAITRAINGGLNGHADRVVRLMRARAALADQIDAGAPITPAPIPAHEVDTSSGRVQETPKTEHIPAGESGDAPENNMAPFIAAALPAIIEAIPKLGKLFGSGSQVAERNVAAAETVVKIVQQATGASNAQAAAEAVANDPNLRAAAQTAIEENWYQLSEAGGGGIDGARKADVAFINAPRRFSFIDSPSFWVATALIVLVFILMGNVMGLYGAKMDEKVSSAIINGAQGMILGALLGYYFGQQTSRNRSQP